MMPRLLITALLCTLLLATTGCTRELVMTDQERINERIPWEIPTPEVDLNAWQAPAQLGTFSYQGDISLDQRHLRMLRYTRLRDGKEQRLELQLFPIPGGWDDMPPSRLIAGQYGPQRQQLGERALHRGALEVVVTEERADVEDALPLPVAVGHLQQQYRNTRAVTLLSVTALPPVFVSATVTGHPDQADDLDVAVREALLAFAAANAGSADASP
ncbi:hypothetical protein [Isoalcanivorax indicus]|uniref:hypothetical protein n=1 Tax=Isoalcanivorax indicus TaxID=2202653 RepID=UPI000DB90599|nr:hypothetical protein [Isoalcanivorax indicus]